MHQACSNSYAGYFHFHTLSKLAYDTLFNKETELTVTTNILTYRTNYNKSMYCTLYGHTLLKGHNFFPNQIRPNSAILDFFTWVH